MNNRTRMLSILALGTVAIVGATTTSIYFLTGETGIFNPNASSNGSGVWKHYAQKLPGEIAGKTNGIREYWVECGSNNYQFTAPTGETPTEGTDFTFSEFVENDPRYIIPINEGEGICRSALLNSKGYSKYTEVPELTELRETGWWYSGTQPDIGKSKKMVWRNTEDANLPWFYVNTLRCTDWITNESGLKTTFKCSDGSYNQNEYLDGYYVLLNDISCTGNINHTGSLTGATYDRGFRGTFDGRNHTISTPTSVGVYNYGIFGIMNGATIENATFSTKIANPDSSLLAFQSNDSIFKNVKINISSCSTGNYLGCIIGKYSNDNTYQNMDLNFSTGITPQNIFGCNTDGNNSFLDVTFKADAKPIGGWTNNAGGGSTTSNGDIHGITFIPNSSSFVNERLDLEAKADPQDTGIEMENVSSIKLVTRQGTEYALGDNLSAIVIPQDLIDDKIGHGECLLLITKNDSSSYSYPVTLITNYISEKEDFYPLRGAVSDVNSIVRGYYAMTQNINMANVKSCPYPSDWWKSDYSGNGFAGIFDGRGYTLIGNLFNCGNGGLFGVVSFDAVVCNLKVTNNNYTGWGNSIIGAVIGSKETTTTRTRLVNLELNIGCSGTNETRKGLISTIATYAGTGFQNIKLNLSANSEMTIPMYVHPDSYIIETTRMNHYDVTATSNISDTVNCSSKYSTFNPGMTFVVIS